MSARARHLVATYGTAVGGLLLFLGFALAADNFLTPANLFTVLRQTSYLIVLGTGFTLALIAAELDLSFASVASLAGVACGGLVHHEYPIVLAILAAVAVGAAFGGLNGFLVTVLRIPSLIATLATASIAVGLAFMATNGVAWVGRWPKAFTGIGRGDLFGVPLLVVWSGLVTLVAYLLIAETRFGVWLRATGDADEATRLAGVPVKRMKRWGLFASGLCAGIAAVLLTASLSSAGPDSADGFLLTAIAAVLLGMTMFVPGKPNVFGTLVGCAIIGVLSNGLVLLGAPYYIQDIALGLIIIASVAISASVLTKAAFSI